MAELRKNLNKAFGILREGEDDGTIIFVYFMGDYCILRGKKRRGIFFKGDFNIIRKKTQKITVFTLLKCQISLLRDKTIQGVLFLLYILVLNIRTA